LDQLHLVSVPPDQVASSAIAPPSPAGRDDQAAPAHQLDLEPTVTGSKGVDHVVDKFHEAALALDRAKSLLNARRLPESETAFEQVIRLGVNPLEGVFGVALVRFLIEDWQAAAAQFRQVLRMDAQNADALYYLGAIAEQGNDWPQARAFYEQAIAIDPQHPYALEKLANRFLLAHTDPQAFHLAMATLDQAKGLLQQRRFVESEAAFKQVIDLGIAPAEGFFGLGLVRFLLEDLAGAAAQFEQVLRIDARNADALYYLGAIAEKRHEWPQARTAYEQALIRDPQHRYARAKLSQLPLSLASDPQAFHQNTAALEEARRLLQERRFAESEAAFNRVIGLGVNVAEGFFGVGLVRFRLEDWDGAAAQFRRVLKINPTHANAHYYLEAIAEKKDPRMLARSNAFYDAGSMLARAQQLLQERRYSESEATYKRVISLGVNPLEGMLGVGLVRFYLEDWETAARAFHRVLAMDPTHADARYYLDTIAAKQNPVLRARSSAFHCAGRALVQAHQLLQERRYEESEASFKRVSSSGVNLVEGLLGVGLVRFRLEDWETAAAQFERVLSIDPANVDARYYRMMIAEKQDPDTVTRSTTFQQSNQSLDQAKQLLKARKLTESEAAFKRVISSGVNLADGYLGVGIVRFHLGDCDTAAGYLRQALQADPQNPDVLYYLGLIAEKQNDLRDARGLYDQVLEKKARFQPYGIFDYLRDDPSPLSLRTLMSIDTLRMTTYPSWTSYLGRFLSIAIVLAVLPIILVLVIPALQTPSQLAADVRPALLQKGGWFYCLAGSLLIAAAVIAVQRFSVTYTFDKGRLRITKGIVTKDQKNVDLWHVYNVEVQQTFFNLLTDDGTLVLKVLNEQRTVEKRGIRITGLAKGPRLHDIREELLNTSVLLRRSEAVRSGYIV
jgi:tetratricopeptide (TPR) repeat protein